MKSFTSGDLSTLEVYRLLTGAVAPRPIALVASKGKQGINLAPFSFFNVVSVDPVMLMFAPLRRMRDGSQKDTYHNVLEHPECSVQVVTGDIVERVNVCAKDFPSEVNEFEASGLTMVDSELITVPRVAESPIQMECRVDRVISLGEKGGAGNMVLCEVLKIHLDDDVYADGQVLLEQLHLVGRNNKDSYSRVIPEAMFDLKKP